MAATLLRAIRTRLVLWYAGVILAALLILGTALYFVEREQLFGPVNDALHSQANALADQLAVAGTCDLGPGRSSFIWACYDSQGNVVGRDPLVGYLPTFADPGLLSAAARNGSATDTIQARSPFGTVERYALAVNGSDGQVAAVVVVGAFVGGQQHALDVMLELLVLLGALTIVASTAGGFWLASRALQPARLAMRRQRHFIADASHELRTPLTLLRADAEVLLRGRHRLDPDDAALLEDVVTEAAHMASLAGRMLDLARLDSGEAHLERDVVDLHDLTLQIARRVTPLADERGIAIEAVAAGGPVRVLGDRELLEQALLGLLDNAIKYNHPGGSVRLRVNRDRGQALVGVEDTGIGIAPEHLARVGERFYRVDQARTRDTGGTGLGVSLVRAIAARHGGSLRYESRPEQGTTATLSLPALV